MNPYLSQVGYYEKIIEYKRYLFYLHKITELHVQYIQSSDFVGWIGILAEWMNHKDVRLSIPATRALVNLDSDENQTFSSYLYLLYPWLRTNKEPEVDVVFVHGLLGGVFFTWRQRRKGLLSPSFIGKNTNQKSPGKSFFFR